jgi:hypothetical protein
MHVYDAEEMVSASHYMNDLPDDAYVYFYAGRWAFDYEVRRFLAPDVQGEDRSREFSNTGTASLQTDRTSDVMFIVFDPYLDLAGEVSSCIQAVAVHELRGDGSVKFSALPAVARPSATRPARRLQSADT